jgi:hypothetical protein
MPLNPSRAVPLLDDLIGAAGLIARLPGYLRHPLSLEEARAIVRRRLECREADFLDLARRAIFSNPASPYRALLRSAGCEPGDLERLVRSDGLEQALSTLYRNGVFLTVDEFKGRRAAVRGSATIPVHPGLLRNPLAGSHYWTASSGSGGAPTSVPRDLASHRDRAVNLFLTLDARGGARWRKAVWSMSGLGPLLWYSVCGGPAVRWFSTADPAERQYWRYRWRARAVHWTSRLAGVPLPRLEHVALDAPLSIVRWMVQTLRSGEVPHLWVSPSSAIRLCRAAQDAGLDLTGGRFTVTGEPVTAARLAVIRGAGGDAVPDYGSAEAGGSVAYGCLAPDAPDETHVFHDLHAVIQAESAPLPGGALLVSSLRQTAPFVLLNVSMGDRAVVTRRTCGCALQALGWHTHLHTIRSYEKLTAGGVTFIDADVIRVLEEVLPRRFGGGPTDYQLVEEEADDGQPRLRLLVHPSIGAVDPGAVSEAFLGAIGQGSRIGAGMALHWRDGGFLRVERAAPRSTPSGKILHLVAVTARPHGR